MMLSPAHFTAFFQELYDCEPFPWQKRLLESIIARDGKWPDTLDLPTGSGKTAAIDIAVFHLALEAGRQEARRAPVRIAFVVDRRLVVDDAFARAKRLANMLAHPGGPITARVAEQLKRISDDGPALIARRLRGGVPREDDWARTPSQPTVLCSTVDQVGSRLLFRGYGVSDSMKPVHAGLIGSDCLILLDEAHLAEPFRQTLEWVRIYKGQTWRESEHAAPWGVALLTATPADKSQCAFSLDPDDRSHPVLSKRLNASKPARLIGPTKLTATMAGAAATEDEETEGNDKDLVGRATAIVEEVQRALEHFTAPASGAPAPAVGVVVNRVIRARTVFELLRGKLKEKIESGAIGEPILMIGPARPLDRDELAKSLEPIRTRLWKEGERRALDKPLIVVATQCIEAGVDIDLDALITEAAPLDALRQRFGRLNRAGRDVKSQAAIIAAKSDISKRGDDAVYGGTIRPAWDCLMRAARRDRGHQVVDFGLNAFAVPMEAAAVSPKPDAPVILPAHLDLLSQTSPIPAADPDVGLYLHGPVHQPDAITIVWRADMDPDEHRFEEAGIRRMLGLVPPRSGEAIDLPIWAVRRWLMGSGKSADLGDVATIAPEGEERLRHYGKKRRAFRWKGDDTRSRWIEPWELQPGDMVIVPASYGGADEYGWDPDCEIPVLDVARKAAEAFAGRRFAVRVAPGLVIDPAVADALAGATSENWRDLRAALFDIGLPDEIRKDLDALGSARGGKVVPYTDVYGNDDEGRPRGIVFAAPFGIKDGRQDEEGQPNSTEDDVASSMPGYRLTLTEHSQDVERKAEAFAKAAGLPAARVTDLKLAGYLHDAGKADPRFQAWLQYGDPLGPEMSSPQAILAKSGRRLPHTARDASGLPENWRHEAFSVRLAPHISRFEEARDRELVLWLIGTHHGHGRPFFPHRDPDDQQTRNLPRVLGLPSCLPPGKWGPQSLAFDWNGLDWSSLFARLRSRYGVWELARMEALLRLADHRASAERAP